MADNNQDNQPEATRPVNPMEAKLQRLAQRPEWRALTEILLSRSARNRASLCHLSPLLLSDQEELLRLQGEERVISWMLLGKWQRETVKATEANKKRRMDRLRREEDTDEDQAE